MKLWNQIKADFMQGYNAEKAAHDIDPKGFMERHPIVRAFRRAVMYFRGIEYSD